MSSLQHRQIRFYGALRRINRPHFQKRKQQFSQVLRDSACDARSKQPIQFFCKPPWQQHQARTYDPPLPATGLVMEALVDTVLRLFALLGASCCARLGKEYVSCVDETFVVYNTWALVGGSVMIVLSFLWRIGGRLLPRPAYSLSHARTDGHGLPPSDLAQSAGGAHRGRSGTRGADAAQDLPTQGPVDLRSPAVLEERVRQLDARVAQLQSERRGLERQVDVAERDRQEQQPKLERLAEETANLRKTNAELTAEIARATDAAAAQRENVSKLHRETDTFREEARNLRTANERLHIDLGAAEAQRQALEQSGDAGGRCGRCISLSRDIGEAKRQQGQLEVQLGQQKEEALESASKNDLLRKMFHEKDAELVKSEGDVRVLRAELSAKTQEISQMASRVTELEELLTGSKRLQGQLTEDLASARSTAARVPGLSSERDTLNNKVGDLERQLRDRNADCRNLEAGSRRAMAALFAVRTNQILVMPRIVDVKPAEDGCGGIERSANEGYELTANSRNEIVLANTAGNAPPAIAAFRYDHVFDRTSNFQVNAVVQYLIDGVLQGENACIVADGYERSGKSSTLYAAPDSLAVEAGRRFFDDRNTRTVSVQCTEILEEDERPIEEPQPSWLVARDIEVKGVHQQESDTGAPGWRYFVTSSHTSFCDLLGHIRETREKVERGVPSPSCKSHVKIAIAVQQSWTDPASGQFKKRDAHLDFIDLAGSKLARSPQDQEVPQSTTVRQTHAVRQFISGFRSFDGDCGKFSCPSMLPAAIRKSFPTEPTPYPRLLLIPHVNVRHSRNATQPMLELARTVRAPE